MKIILFGKNGQVGRRLVSLLPSDNELISFDRTSLDLSNFAKVKEVIEINRPDIVINAAAYTQVDRAEFQQDLTYLVNQKAPEVMAAESNAVGAWFVHYSSDYVFDGSLQRSYTENDEPNPLSVYGNSKLKADQFIQQYCDKYMIFRTCAVFDSYGSNFPNTILRLAKKLPELKVINDQFTTPTHAGFIADLTYAMIQRIKGCGRSLSGLYNVANSGEAVSWYEFAKILIKKLAVLEGRDMSCYAKILPISSAEYQQDAKRPQHSSLNIEKIQKQVGFVAPYWQDYVSLFYKELKK
ncbi:MAG: hypothetical protein DGJ47_001055 [Rickettsiaceae bacterium]